MTIILMDVSKLFGKISKFEVSVDLDYQVPRPKTEAQLMSWVTLEIKNFSHHFVL